MRLPHHAASEGSAIFLPLAARPAVTGASRAASSCIDMMNALKE